MQNITEEQTVFMDEDDNSLYFSGSEATHTIYNHENVFYKFTHPNEVVYSKSEVAGAQGNNNMSFDATSGINSRINPASERNRENS